MPLRRILITGGAGFIGSACAKEFLRRGFDVTITVHRRVPQDMPEATAVRVDLADRGALAEFLRQATPFDSVIHCAGLASDVARRGRLMQANFHAVRNLVDCLHRRPTVRLVHISTTDVYGIRDFTNANEDTPLAKRPGNAYPLSKILAEQYVCDNLPRHLYVILRPGVVHGSGDRTILPRVLAFLRSSPRAVYFGRWRGQNRWPLVNVQTVARAAVAAATKDRALGQAFNVVDPDFVSIEQYYHQVLRDHLPEKAGMKALNIPLAIAWPYAAFGTLLSKLLNRDQPLMDPSLYALRSVAANLDFSSEKLQQLLAEHI